VDDNKFDHFQWLTKWNSCHNIFNFSAFYIPYST